MLRRMGVCRFSVACTHGLFTKEALPRLTAAGDLEEIVTTNTIPLTPEKRHDRLSVLSIGGLVAEAIQRIHFGQSVSSLFTEGT